MAEQFGDKTHEATPYRRQQAREHGQVVKSQDLSSALLLLLGMGAISLLGASLVQYVAASLGQHLGGPVELSLDSAGAAAQSHSILAELAWALLPLLGALFGIAVVVSLLQTGFLYTPSRIVPDISRLDPLKGLGRIFSLPSLARLGFGLFKIAIVGGIAATIIYDKWNEIVGLTALALPQIAVYLVDLLFWTTVKIAAALLVLALIDYGFQRWKHEQDLRMTTQELKEELKTTQGSPEIAQRRRVLRQLARQRIRSVVPKAEFVLTNPTELAIAFAYEPEKMNAPVVVAKGAGAVARQIRRLALEHGVPIIERKPLAQAIYKLVEVNQPIPRQFYRAIGEVLRYVYELKGKPLPGTQAAA
jgi:flagellar biosynthetic protein FlhB